MRILDEDNDRALSWVCLYLTEDEAERLVARVERLLKNPNDHHSHLEDDEHSRQITITIYRDDNLQSFNERSRRLLESGK